jgi:hypothetical protein
MLRTALLCVAIALVQLHLPATALADDTPVGAVPSAMMSGLAKHSQIIEDMEPRGSFTFTGRFEEVEADGKSADVKELSMRSTVNGPDDRQTKILKYTEDGKDKTAEQQGKSDKRRAERKAEKDPKKKKGSDLKMPFLPSEQPKYIFSIAERDKDNPTHVRVNFNPKKAAEDLVKGSAWYDESSGNILSMGFSLSENPTFIDHVDVTIVFGLATPLGMWPSKISFDARGGFLFVHKHYRGSGTFTDPAIN